MPRQFWQQLAGLRLDAQLVMVGIESLCNLPGINRLIIIRIRKPDRKLFTLPFRALSARLRLHVVASSFGRLPYSAPRRQPAH